MSQSTNPNQNVITSAPSNPAPTPGAIPDLMKIGSIPVNTVQEVETAILEPVVKSDTFARFVFMNKGLLHSHSKVEIGLLNASVEAVLPLNVGAYGLIERVALKVGNQTLCEIDDFSQYFAYRSLFISNENQKEREQMTTGRALSHQFAYADRGGSIVNGAVVGTIARGGGESDNMARDVGLDNGKDVNSNGMQVPLTAAFGDATSLTGDYPTQDWQNLKQLKASDRNLYQLSLSELCPFLRHNQLPLYLMKEQVSLELHFTPAGDSVKQTTRACIKTGEAQNNTFSIDTDKLRLISDHIFYPQELMIQYANANKVLNFTYADYRLSKYSQTTDTASTQQIRNVGGAGRIINKLIWGLFSQASVDNTEMQLMTSNHPEGCDRTYTAGPPVGDSADTNNSATFNVKYNDAFEYPIDVDNTARHFHNVNQAEGMIPFVNREEYSNEGESLSARTFNKHPIDTSLGNEFFWGACRLTKQQRINSRGIELYFSQQMRANASGWVQRVWLEVMRTATLQNGYTECYFA